MASKVRTFTSFNTSDPVSWQEDTLPAYEGGSGSNGSSGGPSGTPPDIDPPPDPNPDDGWEETPISGTAGGGIKLTGKNGGNAKVIFDLPDGPTAGKAYIIGYTADWSELSNLGQQVNVGFGLLDTGTEEFWAVGLTGDGDTTLDVEELYSSTEFGRGKPKVQLNQTDLGAAENGALSGENFIRISFNDSGTAYTFETSSGDETGPWDAEVTDRALGTFTDVTEADVFGIFLYMPNSDKGNFTVYVTYYSGESTISTAPEPTAFSNVLFLMQPDTPEVTVGNQEDPTNPGSLGGTITVSNNAIWSTTGVPISAPFWINTSNGLRTSHAAGRLLPATTPFTLEMWFKCSTLSPTDTDAFIACDWNDTNGSQRNWYLIIRPATGLAFFGVWTSGGASVPILQPTGLTFSTVTPQAIAVERDGNTFSFYLDGTRVDQVVSTQSVAQNTYVASTFGYANNATNKDFQGHFGPIRVCNEAIIGGAASYDVRTTPFATS